MFQGTSFRPLGRLAIALVLAIGLPGCVTDSQEEEELVLIEAPEIPPPSPQTMGLAERALQQGRYDDAKELLDRVLYAEPGNERARLNLAEVYLAKGRPNEAEPLFGSLVESPEFGARAQQGFGIVLLLTGRPDEAADALNQSVARDPQLWRAWNGLGAYYDSLEDWPKANAAYSNAIELRPSSALVLNNFGYSLFVQGHLDESIAALTKAVRIDPGFDVARMNLRLAYARKGQYVHAISGAQDKELGQVLNNVGYIALLRGDYENAESYLLRAMEADASFNQAAWKNLSFLKNVQELDTAAAVEPN